MHLTEMAIDKMNWMKAVQGRGNWKVLVNAELSLHNAQALIFNEKSLLEI